jgi:hypothetical protein
MAAVKNGTTEGLAPKAVAATLVPAIPGLIVLILGAVLNDDTLVAIGAGLLGGGGLGGIGAARAKTGTVHQ